MDNVVLTPVIEEVEQSFLDYSLSVITDRAIPAVEDGLKPVMRRILYEMAEDGIVSSKQYVKCATPVGQTMSKYHPHGDSSIYGALVYASQPWNMRYPLIDFHGNNGSRDGDGPAAQRYTECRLAPIAEATLDGIKKDTVDWMLNYAETADEPIYLPGKFPNLICNGTTGIAVAMACSFAPHNLTEVMDAIIYLEKNPDAKIDDLLKFVKGPDFPTGGVVINQDELKSAYYTGKGRARIRGEYDVETSKGKDTIVFTSIPFKVSKENLIAEIDQLCEEKKLEGITEIRDESNMKGVRFIIELAKGYNGDVIANKLYRLTELETTYSFNQVALVGKKPQLMDLKSLMVEYLKHQEDVFRRKNQFELKKLQDRLHILDGLLTAVTDIDNVIKLIKSSDGTASANAALMEKYGFTKVQAQAILDMKLSKLAHTEAVAIQKESDEKKLLAEHIESILAFPEIAKEELCKELEEFKKKFGDARKTLITQVNETPEEKELAEIVPEDCVVVITEAGNIKRIPSASYRTQRRNGKGIKNQDEIMRTVLKTNTIDNLMVFSSFGKVYRLSVNDVPVGTNATRGVSIETLVPMDKNEHFTTATFMSRASDTNQYVWFVTKNGIIKKTGLSEYTNMKRKTGIVATNIKEGDALAKVFIGTDSHLIIFTKNGMCLRFDGKLLNASSRTAIGVKGINLAEDDEVADVVRLEKEKEIVIFAKSGLAKRVPISEFIIQNRAGKGIMCYKNNEVVAACPVEDDTSILVIGNISTICIESSTISAGTRASQGVMVIKDNTVNGITKIN